MRSSDPLAKVWQLRKPINLMALALLVQRALDGDGDAAALLRQLLGNDWRRNAGPVAVDANAS
jgi:hypothetical protein